MTINDNHVPGAVYFDANITYNPTDHVETFLTVDNLADRSPVQVASGPGIAGAPLSVNPALYDVLGRTLRLGFRFHM
jgi:outer membrane receptor protein involved in Fe transport